MDFRIADSFTESLARLTGEEQKAVKTTAFDLQLDPTNPGMQFHKLEKAKDKRFWSVRVNSDVRLIVHRTAEPSPPPLVRVLSTAEEESALVARWLAERVAEGVVPGEMSVFVRSAVEVPRARVAVEAAGLAVAVLDEDVKLSRDRVAVGTMPLSKGLEFRAVAVMACDDEVLPLQARLEEVADDSDLQEVYDTERHLLYVACTRARDHLLVTGVSPASEFLEDLRGSQR